MIFQQDWRLISSTKNILCRFVVFFLGTLNTFKVQFLYVEQNSKKGKSQKFVLLKFVIKQQ